MSKYIDKSSLPCFRYLREIPEEMIEEMIETQNYFMNITGKDVASMSSFDVSEMLYLAEEKCLNTYAPHIFKDAASMNGIPKRLDKALHEFVTAYDVNAKLADNIITECRRLTQVASLSRAMQGLALTFDNAKDGKKIESFPKLLLIEEGLYIKHQKQFSMDFKDLFQKLHPGTAYMTFVQTKEKAGKYGFCIRKIDDTLIRVTLLDRVAGGYTFDLKRAGEDSFSLFPAFSCTMRDGSICEKGRHKPCVLDESECPTKKLSVVRAVLLCCRDYFVNKEKKKRAGKSSGKTQNQEIPEKFRMDGMVSVFDYYNGERAPKPRKAGGDSHAGYKVRPHVRRSYERKLKNGGTTHVRATIIHKTEYKGYESGERINQIG